MLRELFVEKLKYEGWIIEGNRWNFKIFAKSYVFRKMSLRETNSTAKVNDKNVRNWVLTKCCEHILELKIWLSFIY